MTSMPDATAPDVSFARPRVRHEVIEQPSYSRLREVMISVLDHAFPVD